MKIVLITYYWKNSEGGGIKNYVVNLVDALRCKGNEVDVIFLKGDDSDEQYCGGGNMLAIPITCYRTLCKDRPDIILSHGGWFSLVLGAIYKKIHGCKLVYTFHTEPYEKLPLPVKTFYQLLYNSCDCVTFVSKRMGERVTEVDDLSFSRTAITYAGVTPREVSDSEVKSFRDQHRISKDAIVLLAQAMTAHPLKAEGLKLLLRALPALAEIYPNILLIVTREGPYSNELKEFARKICVEEHVIFTGDVENPFVPLEICDVYTHITLGDGLPLALLEAMAMAKPIVATPIGGIPEVIVDGENGILVTPDVGQIAEKIDHLLENRKYAEEIGKCAKQTVEERFTWEQAADRFMQCCAGKYDEQAN